MQDNSRYAVGIDIGTSTVRCVVGHIDGSSGVPTVVGVGEAPNTGMRKGTIVHLQGPSDAIDVALGDAERMSGYEINEASMSINGAHILSTKADGMIAVGSPDHQISQHDITRVEEVATIGKIPANREVLDIVPYAFKLDGQDNIKDPIGMTGTRLEISANVISALTPNMENLRRSAEIAKVLPRDIMPAVLGSARAVLTESQLESGVAVIDMGSATTSLAIFEEGDLQYVAIVPFGGMHITNDLAIGLKTDPVLAEEVKLKHGSAIVRTESEGVSVKQGDEIISFETDIIDDVVGARLEEIFEAVRDELKKAGRDGRLPSGVVLTGGGSNLEGITNYVREFLGVAAQIGKPRGFSGVDDKVTTPEYAAAVGLMFADIEAVNKTSQPGRQAVSRQFGSNTVKSAINSIQNVFKKFKS